MTLLPIIYTSLILFFGILLIVVAISYLLFKARKNTNPLIQEEINKQKHYLKMEMLKHQAINNYNNSVNAQIIPLPQTNLSANQQFSKVQSAPQIYYADRKPNNEQNNYTHSKKNNSENNYYYENRREESKTNITTKPRITNSRIEVLNGTGKFKAQRNENVNDRHVRNDSPDHSEYNLLNFYSDKPANDFSNLTTVRNKSVYGG